MRWIALLALAPVLAACSNDAAPRLIAGGGVADGGINGQLNVYVIDNDTEAPVANATVEVGTKQDATNSDGLVTFHDVSGAQTVVVKAAGYPGTVWADVDGANVTVPVTALTRTADQALLSGTIAGWSSITVPAQHVKLALVLYSQTDKPGDVENSISTSNNTNVCVGQTCNWTIASRTGTVSLVAAIVDDDTKGTPSTADDTRTVIGWAYASGLSVANGVSQSGITLAMVDAGSLQDVTPDLGTPPAALTQTAALVGIQVSSDEVIQLPVSALVTDTSSILVPQPSVFGASATYEITAVAQTTATNQGAKSVVIRHGLKGTTLSAGTWLEPPTNVVVTRTNATFDRVAGAKAHQVIWTDGTGQTVLQATLFDPSKTSFDVPSLVALPSSGTLMATVSAIGADFDVHNFSLDKDQDQLWGVSSQPETVQ